MKRIICLLCFFSTLSFGASFDVRESKSLTEVQKFEYDVEKKSPMLAVGMTWLVPSLGHAYAGNWGRGLLFLGAETLSLVLAVSAMADNDDRYIHTNQDDGYYTTSPNPYYNEDGEDNDWIFTTGIITFLGLRIWEHFDAYKTTKRHNYNLFKEISLQPKISLEDRSVGLQASYKF